MRWFPSISTYTVYHGGLRDDSKWRGIEIVWGCLRISLEIRWLA